MSDVVVVLPLLPVMQIMRASVYRPANSISLMTGTPFPRRATTIGAVSGMPGLLTASSAVSTRSGVWPPSSQAMPRRSSCALYSALMVPASDTKTSNPFCCARTATPTPLSAAPNMTILDIVIINTLCETFYLIFNVMIVAAASRMVVIQKRTVIFDSCQAPRGQLRSR